MSHLPLREPCPAFLFFGVITSRSEIIDETRDLLVERYGSLHPRGESPVFPFPETRTYRSTMGTALKKRFFVVGKRLPQDGLAAVKIDAIDLEKVIAESWKERTGLERPVNIDPGLINDCRIILASTKDHAHRIYRGEGVWEEVTLVFRDGKYRELPWTYRDFKNPDYHKFFEIFRENFLAGT